MRAAAVVVTSALLGCSAPLGRVALLGGRGGEVGVRMLRPGVVGRSCRTTVVGLPLRAEGPQLSEAIAQILAQDPEGDVVADADIAWEQMVTGVYNVRCVRVRGDLGRAIRTVTVPGHHRDAHR